MTSNNQMKKMKKSQVQQQDHRLQQQEKHLNNIHYIVTAAHEFLDTDGQGRINQLGRAFINGRPLAESTRLKIIEMAATGTRPCVISKTLKVSHGCISKIIQRYMETGSIKPGSIGGSKPRVITPEIVKYLSSYRKDNPTMFSWEMREKLINDNICTKANAPSVSSISRMMRHFITEDGELNDSQINSINNEEMDDETNQKLKYLHQKLSEKCNERFKRTRTIFTKEQTFLLETTFSFTHYPDAATRDLLAQKTNLSESKIQVWFSNRRARCRKNNETSSTILQQNPDNIQRLLEQFSSNYLSTTSFNPSESNNQQMSSNGGDYCNPMENFIYNPTTLSYNDFNHENNTVDELSNNSNLNHVEEKQYHEEVKSRKRKISDLSNDNNQIFSTKQFKTEKITNDSGYLSPDNVKDISNNSLASSISFSTPNKHSNTISSNFPTTSSSKLLDSFNSSSTIGTTSLNNGLSSDTCQDVNQSTDLNLINNNNQQYIEMVNYYNQCYYSLLNNPQNLFNYSVGLNNQQTYSSNEIYPSQSEQLTNLVNQEQINHQQQILQQNSQQIHYDTANGQSANSIINPWWSYFKQLEQSANKES
ncbi:hypothetical protein SNEBB_009610 [Seison nebaliae]|nr:hypothetical protein SNEBB_009610 [Seison nebaliae]